MSLFLALFVFSFAQAAVAQEYRMQLRDVVVGYDASEGDFTFPLAAISHSGELYLEQVRITVSKNCKNNIFVRDQRLHCAPYGDKSKAFVFATFAERRAESDESGWFAYFLKYDSSKVRFKALKHHRGGHISYYLTILN